jgi:tRNA threonylcarbamoyladenosine biosynthesis protein TsaE
LNYPAIVKRRTRETLHSAHPDQTLATGERIGASLAASCRAPSFDGAVVLLVGPLGAGKTVLAKGIARGLGVADQLVSPTYTIVSEYRGGPVPLYHIDLYRIEGRDQLENLGLDDILRSASIMLVEWGEKLETTLEGSWTRITIDLADDDGRAILVEDVER